MSDAEAKRFHEQWLGLVQPVEGLVVSIPVLVDAQCLERQPPHVQQKLAELCPPTGQGEAGPEGFTISDAGRFLREFLGLTPDRFDAGDTMPEELCLYVPEGRQTLRPSMALRKESEPPRAHSADTTPAALAGACYELLVWELPAALPLDKPETVTGTWDYPPSAKFDRLLRHCRVPIGLLTNREVVRLVYAPHGESSGAITFKIDDMVSVGGRPILDAFVMLLSANRIFDARKGRSLREILAESRERQASVTNDLADQMFEALQVLLRGFEAAAERAGRDLLDDALARENDHLYKGLLTVLLRLVFLLYAEDRGLLPVDKPMYAKHLSVLALFDQLQSDRGAYPDSMSRRFGAWGRLITVFRAVFLGIDHGELHMPARRGSLFDPHVYPFLEGWGPAGSAPITQPEARAEVELPTVDDETVFHVLEKLVLFEGQRLSYRALDVEQIGSVYEALMGYHVVPVHSDAVCMRPHRLWVSAEELRAVPEARRAKWLKDTVGLSTAQAERLRNEIGPAKDDDEVLEALSKLAVGRQADLTLAKAKPGQLVLQPGAERRRTSSHYTPRSLSAPIARRTLEPLLAVMGEAPASERILNLKICDPAMGSGAFLVEACRFLADHVVAAWTREERIEEVAKRHADPLLHAKRLVAQRCLYGVDKNNAAVELAKLSLWLLTLAKDLPFTFLDHSLRHGDSLVGLDFDQIRSFHWKPGKQLELFAKELDGALEEAIALRKRIEDLAFSDDLLDQKEKERLLWDAQDALERVRLIGDLVVGAFFAHQKDKEREKERQRRLELVSRWLAAGGSPPDELRAMQEGVRRPIPVFHWMLEFPEVFYAERPDPLDESQVNRAAFMDAFMGNPPFLGGRVIGEVLGDRYAAWVEGIGGGSRNADLCARFFLRTNDLLGVHGTIGMVATSTISQGDTRTVGLQQLLSSGLEVYSAQTALRWPGDANVIVSQVHLAKGRALAGTGGRRVLDATLVSTINSSLCAASERPDPTVLACNAGRCFQGHILGSMGFVVTPAERIALLEGFPGTEPFILPYLGGEELNSSPVQGFDRFVINLGDCTLDEAQQSAPHLLEILRSRVKDDWSRSKSMATARWWCFWRLRREMSVALSSLKQCIVISRHTKHLCMAFQPVDRVFSEATAVFAMDRHAQFAVLQSRAHEVWSRLLSSEFGSSSIGLVLRYIPTRCFETFPFPTAEPHAPNPTLEEIGKRLYDVRGKYMVDENVGLTITYNRLKDPACDEPRILELRRLHEEMDRKVLDAYGWSDIEVPPYCLGSDDDKKKNEKFEDEVIDRLFVLNATRAEEEQIKGIGADGAKKRRRAEPGKGRGKTKAPEGQLSLPGEEEK